MDDQRTDRKGGDVIDKKVADTLSRIVRQRRNQLRKTSFETLQQIAPISLEIEAFRDKRVCIAIAADKTNDAVSVLLRGFIWLAPRYFVFEGFTKRSDETWMHLIPDDIHGTLAARIEENGPVF